MQLEWLRSIATCSFSAQSDNLTPLQLTTQPPCHVLPSNVLDVVSNAASKALFLANYDC